MVERWTVQNFQGIFFNNFHTDSPLELPPPIFPHWPERLSIFINPVFIPFHINNSFIKNLKKKKNRLNRTKIFQSSTKISITNIKIPCALYILTTSRCLFLLHRNASRGVWKKKYSTFVIFFFFPYYIFT